MIRSALFAVALAGPAVAEQHLADLHQSIQACAATDCIGAAAGVCMDTTEGGHSTFGMMSCLLAERDAWDARLNAAYGEARAFARSMDAADQEFFPEFAVRADQVRDAQRAWIVYRDANCAMAYGAWGAGSMRQIAGADCLMQMTAERTLELLAYTETMR